MKNLSILLPTRGRPFLMRQFLESLARTVSDIDSIEIILYRDEGDKEDLRLPESRVYIKTLAGQESNMGGIMNLCYKSSSGRYIMLANDDMIFRSKRWDKRISEEFSKFPDELALVYGNDLYYGKRMATFPAVSRAACELMGGVCSPAYKNHGIDSHLLDVFQRLRMLGHDRLAYMPDVIFEHMNYGLTEAFFDGVQAQSKVNNNSAYIACAGERQEIAARMAKEIESQTCKR